jgi:2-amino-4-hydroxy-6-hydroxymethyldihydropteridine diphosphokinase
MSIPSNTTASSAALAVVSLGSNLRYMALSPREIVTAAMARLSFLSVESQSSSLYLTEPIDCPDGVEDFINAVMILSMAPGTSARELLLLLQGVEKEFGRRRGGVQNQARTLDLDIISFENQQLESNELTLPHPRAVERRFVLMPLAEILPEMVLPGQSLNVSKLLAELPSSESVQLHS